MNNHKSERYLYELRPDWDRSDKEERKNLRKINRRETREKLQGYSRREFRPQ